MIERILDYVYPRRCPVCDEVVPRGGLICAPCKETLQYVEEPRCFSCGKTLLSEDEEMCDDCKDGRHIYRKGLALYEYPAISKSIYRFKYQGRCEYADFFGKDMAKHLRREIKQWKAQALVPVPLYAAKERKRGFNQAELLANVLGRELGLPVEKNLIIRRKHTVPMKNLDAAMRQINLKKAFLMGQDDVKLKRVIIVDDIYTTGSTIDAMAGVLLAAGIEEVYFVALSIGNGI